MYEEKEHKINWITLLKRIIWYVLVVVVILVLIALITRCAKNTNKGTKAKTTIDLSNEVLKLQNASLQYFNADNLPQKEKESKSVKLKYLIAKDYIDPIIDSKDNTCDANESYSEVTRQKNNYYLVTKIKCGKNSKTKKVYIGCFESCGGNLCIGNKEDVGVCKVNEVTTTTSTTTTTTKKTITSKKPTSTTITTRNPQTSTLKTIRRTTTSTTRRPSSTTTKTTTKKTTTTTRTTTTTKKTTTSTSTTKKTTTSTSTTKKTSTTPKTTQPTTQPKCYTHAKCTNGVLANGNTTCMVTYSVDPKKTQYGNPITINSGSYSTPSECLNAPTGMVYECTLDRVIKSNTKPYYTYVWIKTIYKLCGSDYTYNESTNKCEKTGYYHEFYKTIHSRNYSEPGYVNIGQAASNQC